MTDNEINARVAMLRGEVIVLDADGCWYVDVGGHRWPPPAYCTDPAAWAGLLVWLAGEGRRPMLNHNPPDWFAAVHENEEDGWVTMFDAAPGRALALAALRAHGVEV